jgi:hypothetical protein
MRASWGLLLAASLLVGVDARTLTWNRGAERIKGY